MKRITLGGPLAISLATGALCAGLLSAAPQPARAAPLLHDSVAEFTRIVNRQAPGVAAGRSILGKMFDNSLSISATSFFSLGLSPTASSGAATQPFAAAPGASLDFFIDAFRGITGGAFSEATGTPTGHAEQADVYLGFNGGDWRRVGTIHNGHGLTPVAPDGRVLNADPIVAWSVLPQATVAGGIAYSFAFTVTSGEWNTLRIVDGRASTGSGRDGFDILELELSSVVIPEPGTLFLLGAGLLGLGAARRRRTR
ncbi:MAG TPA: PEP-CTERM sorting domain-containing protein [Falsiroseomonas sp.]|nr:PEP-CTERM sorting domain-containing protein [Falsiroseomonas sp.]